MKARVVNSDERLSEAQREPCLPLTKAQRAEVQAEFNRHREHWDRVYDALRLDAQTCAKAMQFSPVLDDPVEPKRFDDVVRKSLADFRSGKALMDQLGAGGLLDPAMAGMLLAIRSSLIEETGATVASEMLLIDMAVIAFANAMRIQSMVGNAALLIEAEMFGQPSLRASWKKARGSLPADIKGLAVDEHVARLRDQLMPLVERFHRLARESVESLARMRECPSAQVERARTIEIALV